jgi:hypothetical protein
VPSGARVSAEEGGLEAKNRRRYRARRRFEVKTVRKRNCFQPRLGE